MPTLTLTHVGHVAVDSGTIAVADPCNCQEVEDAIDGTPFEDGVRPLVNDHGVQYATVIPTAIGDGLFSVYVESDDEGPTRIIVDLVEPALGDL